MRLNKFISESGRCSRREADEWIAAGRVRVNGRQVALGAVIEDGDEVAVDGERLHPRGGARAKPRVYIALNKPVGITCTTEADVENNIVAFVDYPERIFPIGRLDKDSDGLILLTNDGDIVNPILRAENRHEKEYLVTINRPVTDEFCRRMSRGVDIGGELTRPCKVHKLSKFTFRIVLTQGLNRQIRRMCEAFGYWVRSLTRVRIVNVRLGHLKTGQWRKLTPAEVAGLVPAREPAVAPPPRKSRPGVAHVEAAPIEPPPRRTRPGAVRSSSMRPESPWRPGRAPAQRNTPLHEGGRQRGAAFARGKTGVPAPAAKPTSRQPRRPSRPAPRSR